MFEKEWGNKGFSCGTSLPLLLTFGWTFRRDPPSWPLCKVSAKTGTRRNCKWARRGNVQRKKKVARCDTRPALLFELFKCTDDKKLHEEMFAHIYESISATGRQTAISIENNGPSTEQQPWKIKKRKRWKTYFNIKGKIFSPFWWPMENQPLVGALK